MLPKNSPLCPNVLLLFLISILLMMVLNCEGRGNGNKRRKWKPPSVTPYPKENDETVLYRLIGGLGLKKESYKVATADGYILCLTRLVLPGKKAKKDKGIPMLMVNGLFLHSDAWLLQADPVDNPAIYWLMHGYDVWLGDQRGTQRSRGHKEYDFKTEKKYWDFTFHETGYHDLPAFIDFILRKTNKKKICYCGLSLGTTFGFVLLSERPEYNKKVHVALMFVPVGDMPVLSSRNVNTQISFKILINLMSYYQMVGSEALVMDVTSFKLHGRELCKNTPYLFTWQSFMSFAGGLSTDIRYTCHQTSLQFGGTSVGTFLHTLQLFDRGEFRNYEYGDDNWKRYRSKDPPMYNYSKITAPTAFYISDLDEFSPAHVVRGMMKKFGGPVYECLTDKTHHTEPMFGIKYGKTYNPETLKLLNSATGRASFEKFKSKKCKL